MLLRSTRRLPRRRAFTLVEMLIVIGIIAVLAALLLPAVNMAREAARRASCSNNLKNLHLAIQQFDNAKGHYPASRTFWNSANYTKPLNWNASGAAAHTLTWVHEIMPYIERQDMRTVVEYNLSNNIPIQQVAGKIAIVFCSSDEIDDSVSSSLGTGYAYSQLSYALNTGVADNTSINAATATVTGFDWPQNGLFMNQLKGGTKSPPTGDWATGLKIHTPSLGDLTNGDGATNTILIVENADLEEWNYAPTEFNVGVVWDDDYTNGPRQTLNKYPPLNPPDTKPDTLANIANSANPSAVLGFARPLSLHPTGFMVCFAGGNIKFVSESMNYKVYQRLMTSNGKKYLPAGSNNATLPAVVLARGEQMVPLADGDF